MRRALPVPALRLPRLAPRCPLPRRAPPPLLPPCAPQPGRCSAGFICRGGGGWGALPVGPAPLSGGPFRRPLPGLRWSAARQGCCPAFGWDAPPAPTTRPPPVGGLPSACVRRRLRPGGSRIGHTHTALLIITASRQGYATPPTAPLTGCVHYLKCSVCDALQKGDYI